MKSQFTMKKATVFLLALIASAFFFSCEFIDFDGENPAPNPNPATKDKIDHILEEFTISEEEKDGETHRKLFLSASSQVNFVLKNYGNPYLAPLTRDQWIGFFSSWDYDYYPVYTDHHCYIENGVAINRHFFQGYKNETEDIYGTDLFMFVDTQEGWKILNLSATVVNPDDHTDYPAISLGNTMPSDALDSFEKGFNEKDFPSFESAFTSSNASCFRIKNKLKEAYSDDEHSALAFYESIPANISGLNIQLDQEDISVHDQMTAVASSTYTIRKGHLVLEQGKMLATLVATPDMGWKISAIVFSISKQLGTMLCCPPKTSQLQ